MKYNTGNSAKIGDRVRLWKDCLGTVVCSIDDEEYTLEFPRNVWSYMKIGILIEADNGSLFHYVEPNEDFESL